MTELIPGWTVEMLIPQDVRLGLRTGEYELRGGVIRWAAGTKEAGRIVRHLVPTADEPATAVMGAEARGILGGLGDAIGRLDSLQPQWARSFAQPESATDFVLKLASGTMDLAGLNLAVSAMGFAALNRKLDGIEGQLRALQADVKEIKNLLERKERARLRSAIRDLLRIEATSDASDRRTILHNARQTLGEIHENYIELLPAAATVESGLAYEEYFCVTALARARCTAELGMLGLARQELNEAAEFWRTETRRISRDLLLANQPERLLEADFAELPFARISAWLDFTYDEQKGYGWIDDLRLRSKQKADGTRFFSIGNRFFQSQPAPEQIAPSLEKLSSRSAVLDGYVAQYDMLDQAQVLPSEFEKRLRTAALEQPASGFLLLRPSSGDLSEVVSS
jgi:hypothetical protein